MFGLRLRANKQRKSVRRNHGRSTRNPKSGHARFQLPYRRAGSGPTVLFLHNAGGSSGWTPWHEKLAESVDLISPEHPGWDSAETPDWLDHTTDLAFFYLDVMEKLDLRGHCHVVFSA